MTEMPVLLNEANEKLQVLKVSLEELQSKYDPVDITDHSIMVTRQLSDYPLGLTPAKPDLRELGSTGQSLLTGLRTGEYNPELMGKQGLMVYDKMRKSDGQVKSTLKLVKAPVLAGHWYIEPASDSAFDIMVGKYINDNLNKWMYTSWNQLLTETLLMLDYGYYAFEKVFAMKDGLVIWKKFSPRQPMDIQQWAFDEYGCPTGFITYNPENGETFIPEYKIALFTNEMEAGNLEGTSVLRSAYKHWYYKENFYKIDAIQKERHGIGIPIIMLPPNYTTADKTLANEIGENLRTNENAHVVVPPLWEIMFLKLEGQPVDALKSAEYHDMMIARNVLGQFMNSQSTGSVKDQADLFVKATRYVADHIRDVFNRYCIPQLVYWNWGDVPCPELRVRRIGDTVDWRTISFALRNFVGAGIIVPDDQLEEYIREEMDLPRRDEATARQQNTPQLPSAGPPRQSSAGNMKQQAQGTGSANAGNDNSGK